MALTQVKTTGIADDAITSAKIADDAVVTAAIADDAVVTAAIADDAVTGANIADDTVAEANMANDAISLTELKAGTDGQIISWDASGDPVAVGPGTDGQVLTSTGAGSPPAFETINIPAGVGGDTGVDFNDNVKIRSGTGNDLEIYHNGSHSIIHDNGTGDLKLIGDDVIIQATNDETMAKFVENGAVELYHDNNKSVETTSTGLKTYTGGTTGVVDSLELTASGNGGSGRGVGIKFSPPGSSNSVHAADIEGLMETAASTATSAQLLFKVAKSDGTLTERMRLQPGGVTCISSTETTGHNNATKTLYIQGEETNNVNHICRINNKSTSSDSDDTAPLFLTKGSGTNDSNCWFAVFGIAATNGSGNATGSGGIGANGGQNAQFISISDNRLKENITPVTGAIDKIKAITPVSFDWIEKKNEETGEIENSAGHVNYGFTAQDVETTFPEYVATTKRKIGDVENVKSLSGGMTAGYVSVLTAALKEAVAKIETLETKVAALEAG